ncbi:mitochondrial large subunit ribosomal protein-domain-containing protein [Annulohypoxylon moriforme]|nr:mitochondrial large subunit ribosomal protein-domain-containing protein [Annulohypoxylon moriforme]
MLLPRVFRPIATHPAPFSTSLTRFALPIRSRCLSTTIQQPESIPEPINPASSSETAQPEPEPQQKASLPYFVGRNSLNNLSVYHENKRGGNLKLTLLKNGEGDLAALKQDIKEALQLPDRDVTLNSVTKHIVIRGHKRLQVLNFLQAMGF